MTPEQQLTSLELSKKLKELGVKQESLYYWLKSWLKSEGEKEYRLFQPSLPKGRENLLGAGYDMHSAFTVAELGELLPAHQLEIRKGHKGWEVKWFKTDALCPECDGSGIVGKRVQRGCSKCKGKGNLENQSNKGMISHQVFEPTEAEAKAKMIIYLLEKKLIEL